MMMSLVLLCGVSTVIADMGNPNPTPLITPTHTSGTSGVDRVGGDLPNMPMTLSISSPPQECAQLCLDTPSCVAWSFQAAQCTATKHSYDQWNLRTNHPLQQKGTQWIETTPAIQTPYIATSRQHYDDAQHAPIHAAAAAAKAGTNSLCWLKSSISPLSPAPCHTTGVPHAYVEPSSYNLYPVSSVIIPQGWLLQEMETQANGLAGHLHLFWADVQHSSWLGGTADTGLHERLPYWLNAVTPMIYQLQHAGALDVNSTALLQKIESFIEYVLAHQKSDGWLGPTDVYDPWSKMPLIMSLFPYVDQHPDLKERVLDAIYRFLHSEMDWLLAIIANGGLTGWDWWSVRSQDIQISLLTLYDMDAGQSRIDRGETQFLMDISEILHGLTFDWKPWFRYYMPPTPVTKNFNLTTHGVNSAMALKASAVWSRFSHDPDDVKGATDSVDRLYKYHGMSSGIFGCDEHLAGPLPQRGTELCTVVEAMFSFSTNMAILGDAQWGDRTESLMFNALPATMTPDLWAHQYLQQQNEVNAQVCDPHVWAADGPNSNIYGLEPNYGCCTANHGQGIPKYVSNMYMSTTAPDMPGMPVIIASLYGPSILNTSDVTVTQTTNYPFCESPCAINFHITTQLDMIRFQYRIPEWSRKPVLVTPDGQHHSLPTGSHWESYDIMSQDVTLTLLLDMALRVTRKEHANNAAAIYYGPLLLSMLINANITVLAQYAFNSQDLQMEPTTTWTYALKLQDDAHPENDLTVHVAPNIPKPYVFDPQNPAIWVSASGRMISWNMELNAATTPPQSPVSTNSSLQSITLVPYGVSLLRISELPTCAQ